MGAETLVGLDIGTVSVRAVETRRTKAGPVITNFGQAPLPEGAVKGGVVTDEEAVALALKQLWASARIRSRKVILGVTNRQVVVREMSVTNLPARELRRSLPLQVRQVLPLPVERSLLDFHPLEEPGDSKTVRGLLIAAPKESVLAAVYATERAGLYVVQVDLASFALLRAASRLDSQVEAIVDIGAQATTVVVHADGEPVIVRTIPRGGAEISETIAARLGISAGDAEALKCRVGLRSEAEPDAAGVVADAVRPLINEIRSSFDYLMASDQQTRVTRLVLSGGGALLPGLAEDLGTRLNIEVLLADPVVRLRDVRRGRPESHQPFGSSATVAVGLTLRAA